MSDLQDLELKILEKPEGNWEEVREKIEKAKKSWKELKIIK